MWILHKCKNIFIDFDGVIVDSNKFKEEAIEKSILKLFGNNKKSKEAVNYFNANAGISRKEKLSKFYDEKDVLEIMKIYSNECDNFFSTATPTEGLVSFLEYIQLTNKNIKIYILSGGEKNEINLFLKQNNLLQFFEDILSSEQSKLDHMKEKKVSENDIFIGDSKNDLKTSLQSRINFILFEGYKSLESFPTKTFIKKNNLLRTENFRTLLDKFIK